MPVVETIELREGLWEDGRGAVIKITHVPGNACWRGEYEDGSVEWFQYDGKMEEFGTEKSELPHFHRYHIVREHVVPASVAPSVYKRTPFNDMVAKVSEKGADYLMVIGDESFVIRRCPGRYEGRFRTGKKRGFGDVWRDDEPYGVVCKASESNLEGPPMSTVPIVEAD